MRRSLFLILASFSLLSSLSLVKPKPVQAISNPIEAIENFAEAIQNFSLSSWLSNSFQDIILIFIQSLSGDIPQEGLDLLKNGQMQEYLNGLQSGLYLPGGVIGATSQLTASLYNPPISGIEYVAGIFNQNLLNKPAYAQGPGFIGLSPLTNIWRQFRNIVYILSSLIFIIIGIMIIMRVKISPQATISLQYALPRLITTLLLVTFSFAIAGLLIDLMNFLQAVGIALIAPNPDGSLTGGLLGTTRSFSDLANPPLSTVWHLMYKAAPLNMFVVPVLVIGLIISAILFFTGPSGLIATGITAAASLLILLIVILAISIWTIKFFFGCLKAYFNVILKIILSPFEIGLGAIPNSKLNFSSWITGLIANLSVFPISLLFLVLANKIILEVSHKTLWAPSIINPGGNLVDIISSVSGGLIPAFLGIMTILTLSKLPELIPQVVFSLKPSAAEAIVGENAKLESLPIIGGQYKAFRSGAEKRQAENYARYQQNIIDTTTGQKIEELKNKGVLKGNKFFRIFDRTSQPTSPPEVLKKDEEDGAGSS